MQQGAFVYDLKPKSRIFEPLGYEASKKPKYLF